MIFLLLYKFSSFPIFTQPSAVTLCALCMPKAFWKPHPQPLSEWRGEWSPRLPLLCCLCLDRSVNSLRYLYSYSSTPNTQHPTPIFGSNALWTLYAEGLLWARNCAPKSSVNSVRSVREKPPQRVSQLFFLSQKNTEEQNTQHSIETLSQPISQNLTANISWNVLWTLYAGGLLWVRNCAQKGSVKSVRSVREKTPHEINCAQKGSNKSVSSVRENVF